MSNCDLFIKKWFDGADEQLANFKKTGVQKWVTAKFTLISNNSKGNVCYSTSTGIFGYIFSLLYYSRKSEGANLERVFTSLNPDNPETWFKPIPCIESLFSDKRIGKRVFPIDLWHPYDPRQPFDIAQSKPLFLSISHQAGGDIFVTLKLPPSSKSKLADKHKPSPTNFEFVASCAGKDIIYGSSNSTAFIISFNGFEYTARLLKDQDWPGHKEDGDSRKNY